MINILPNTIFLTIGPSNCGKSYYCENFLIPELKKLQPITNRDCASISYISSDNIRRQLLGQENFHKYHDGMLKVSYYAFEMLHKQLECATSFPVNSEYVIVDTKGTNENFRNKVFEIADKNHYKVVILIFNYDYSEYGKYGPILKFIHYDIKKVKELLNAKLQRNKCVYKVIQINSSDFENSKPEFYFDRDLYLKCFVENDNDYIVISDIHGCYDELIELLKQYDIIVEDHKIVSSEKKIIINGDYIDKGPKIFDMIEFCYQNMDNIYITVGNHENRLYKELTNGLEHISEPWFNTFDIINDEYKEKFIKVFENSLPFVANDKFVVTHAPCSNKYLTKIDNKSMSKQRSFVRTEKDIDLYDEMSEMYIFDENPIIHHVFGHIQTSTPGNTIHKRTLIDGGCVIGGKLVGVEIGRNGRIYQKQVNSLQPKEKELAELKPYIKKVELNQLLDYEQLSYKEQQRVKYMVKDKVNFISGTMSPCDKYNDKLESIESAIDFFKTRNVNEIVIQPKYMGSRCNIYLFKNNSDCYAISRNGFKIKLDLDSIYDKLRSELKFNWSDIKLVILDGELMPWSALGEGLIDDFKLVDDNISVENDFLSKTGFDAMYKQLLERVDNTSFRHERNTTPKKDLINQYGNFEYENFKNALDYQNEYISVKDKQAMKDVHEKQIQLYGSKGNIDYKPFAILKIVYTNGTEECVYDQNKYTNETMFNFVNKDKCHKYNLLNEEEVEACISQFNQYTMVQKYEGVVMKPNNFSDIAKSVPYMKIRNPEYLTITYGYDYQFNNKYKKLYNRKGIKNKMKTSIIEWKQGMDMLRVKYEDISDSNNVIKNLFANFIIEDNKEKTFDPRL